MARVLIFLLFFPLFLNGSLDYFDPSELKYLKGSGEPSLRTYSCDADVYRLTEFSAGIGMWRMFVRIEMSQDKDSYAVFGYSGNQTEWFTEKRRLDRNEWEGLSKLIQSSDFYRILSNDNRMGADGTYVIFERIEDGKYHYVFRWSPESDPEDQRLKKFLALREKLFSMHDEWINEFLTDLGEEIEPDDPVNLPENPKYQLDD